MLRAKRLLPAGCLRAGPNASSAQLPELAGASRPFSLLYPANRHMPLRVRVLIDLPAAAATYSWLVNADPA